MPKLRENVFCIHNSNADYVCHRPGCPSNPCMEAESMRTGERWCGEHIAPWYVSSAKYAALSAA